VNEVTHTDDTAAEPDGQVTAIEPEQTAVSTYERGAIALKDVARSVLLRFLPASAISLVSVIWLTLAPGNPMGPMLGVLGRWTAWIGLGFAMGLLVMRPWLYPDAKITGLRSVLAGLLGALLPLTFLRLQVGLVRPFEMTLVLLVAGVGVALGMFFPWLTATPAHMRDDLVDPSEADRVLLTAADENSPT